MRAIQHSSENERSRLSWAVRVLGAGDPLADGQQRGEMVASPDASPIFPVQ